MVGQDVTRWVRMLPDRRERIRRTGGAFGAFLHQITELYANSYASREPMPGFPVHDLLVMAYALRPELFEAQLMHVDVETNGRYTRGMTVGDLRWSSTDERNVNVCLKADADGILDWYESVMI